ncbi:hypothetical protein BaRGS_00030538 [Batillaria attramentaria]|uniref:Uncharacterized protein n=1 Tax=Batillaria attramentaria TaxID=370345 RepID=A0ABD0JT28_9CAEN
MTRNSDFWGGGGILERPLKSSRRLHHEANDFSSQSSCNCLRLASSRSRDNEEADTLTPFVRGRGQRDCAEGTTPSPLRWALLSKLICCFLFAPPSAPSFG